ncbi:phage tail spike protein [Companilactobacillus ginsenosidimutans]|uniref:Tail spike domain-containing protein n=1 Tax=Companilactobacillus ginsenosidimutans TaxID=1007676 RepID=A0A0H4QXC9_9LACO|nr:phage tail spike protein [Companilactobacillus ginsenosidimutans]AKP66104.1 hypothetical protein ABM34_00050 [Companilactobacillus ginsenosidimutans]AKP66140.1 hypothetical protein ABM34_00290 [Companilactobacillus ginsenosidimutans]
MTLLYFLDETQSLLGIVDRQLSGTEKIQINKANELDCSIPFSKRNSELAQKSRYVAVPTYANDPDFAHLYSITTFDMTVSEINFKGFETMYEDMTATWVGKIWGKDDTTGLLYVDELLDQLIYALPNEKTWIVGVTPDHDEYEPQSFDDEDVTVSSVLSKAVEDWGFEFDFVYQFQGNTITKRAINVYKQLGEDRTDLHFDVRKDLTGSKYTEDRSGIYTALVGYGATLKIEEPDAPVSDQWNDVPSPGTVKVNKTFAILYTRELVPYTGRRLGQDSEWRTDMYMEKASTHEKYYRVSTNQYVNYIDVDFTAAQDDNEIITDEDNSTTSTGGATTERIVDFTQVEWTSPKAPVNKPKGQGYVEVPSATASYGYSDGSPRIGVVTFDDEVLSSRLLSRTYMKLLTMCTPKRKLETSFNQIGTVGIGDTIYLYDERLDVYVEERITEINRNLLNIHNSTVVAGSTFALTPEARQSGIEDMIRTRIKKYS